MNAYEGLERKEYNKLIRQHHRLDRRTTTVTIENLPINITLDTNLTEQKFTLE